MFNLKLKGWYVRSWFAINNFVNFFLNSSKILNNYVVLAPYLMKLFWLLDHNKFLRWVLFQQSLENIFIYHGNIKKVVPIYCWKRTHNNGIYINFRRIFIMEAAHLWTPRFLCKKAFSKIHIQNGKLCSTTVLSHGNIKRSLKFRKCLQVRVSLTSK